MGKPETYDTGFYWPCPVNPVLHPHRPVANPIKKKNCHFVDCGCGSFQYLPRSWDDETGMTAQQCRQAGLEIATLARPPKKAAPANG